MTNNSGTVEFSTSVVVREYLWRRLAVYIYYCHGVIAHFSDGLFEEVLQYFPPWVLVASNCIRLTRFEYDVYAKWFNKQQFYEQTCQSRILSMCLRLGVSYSQVINVRSIYYILNIFTFSLNIICVAGLYVTYV